MLNQNFAIAVEPQQTFTFRPRGNLKPPINPTCIGEEAHADKSRGSKPQDTAVAVFTQEPGGPLDSFLMHFLLLMFNVKLILIA